MSILGMLGCGGIMLGMALWLAYRLGHKAAQLEALHSKQHKQAEEQAKKNEIETAVNRMSRDTVYRRLHDVSRQ